MSTQLRLGAGLVVLGQVLILIRDRPFSDFYFPLAWAGLVLVLDAALKQQTGRSLWNDAKPLLAAMALLSIGFWWFFELLNQAVHNWVYIGAGSYSGAGYVTFASLDFSFVLPAVWVTSLALESLFPVPAAAEQAGRVPRRLLQASLIAGSACIILAVVAPSLAFGLIWLCMFLLLDPLNYWLGRPSMLALLWSRQWRLPAAFAGGTLICGVFWEGWNFWARPKWIYDIPHVGFWRIFEMPLLGWTGYLAFGLELFAMTNFALAVLRLPLGEHAHCWFLQGTSSRSSSTMSPKNSMLRIETAKTAAKSPGLSNRK